MGFLLGCIGAWGIVREHGAVSGVTSGFSASKAMAFPDAFFPFFLGEFFNVDGVDIHSIWINFWLGVVILIVVLSCGVMVVRVSVGNSVCCIPLGFEVHGMRVPVFKCGGNSVCGIESFHERDWDSSCEEVDKGVLLCDFAKSNVVFELGGIISEWKIF